MCDNSIIKSKFLVSGEILNVWSVYNTGYLDKVAEFIESYELNENEKVIIGGDFNLRIGNLGSFAEANEGKVRKRKSKDSVINTAGRRFVQVAEDNGFVILNGWE